MSTFKQLKWADVRHVFVMRFARLFVLKELIQRLATKSILHLQLWNSSIAAWFQRQLKASLTWCIITWKSEVFKWSSRCLTAILEPCSAQFGTVQLQQIICSAVAIQKRGWEDQRPAEVSCRLFHENAISNKLISAGGLLQKELRMAELGLLGGSRVLSTSMSLETVMLLTAWCWFMIKLVRNFWKCTVWCKREIWLVLLYGCCCMRGIRSLEDLNTVSLIIASYILLEKSECQFWVLSKRSFGLH